MLSALELHEYYDRHQLCPAARRYIDSTRTSQPARRVGSHGEAKNVTTQFASEKLEQSRQAESFNVELLWVLKSELDEDTLEFWDQPPPVSIRRTNKNGVKTRGPYYADFLLLHTSGPRVVQNKTAAALLELSRTRPADWVCREDGYHFLPADDAFAEIGLPHRVVSPSPLFDVEIQNYALLRAARRAPDAVTPELAAAVQRCFQRAPLLLLSDLLHATRQVDRTAFAQLILRRELFVRLDTDVLANADSAWVARAAEYLIAAPTTSTIDPPGEHAASGVYIPSEASIRRAIKRKNALTARPNSRYARQQAARTAGCNGDKRAIFQSLLPRYVESGNRRARFTKHQETVLENAIDTHVANERRPPVALAYRKYCTDAKAQHPELPPASRTSFVERIARRDAADIAGHRGGDRARNAATEPSPVETRSPAPFRPFQAASIDDCLLPWQLVLGTVDGKKHTVRPWITALIDIATDYILAVWMSLKRTTMLAVAATIRRCARLHGRLPERIHSDGGSNFHANAIEAMVALLGVDYSQAPPAYPRSNSSAEQLFSLMNTEFLPLMAGHMLGPESPRSVSRGFRPVDLAELSPTKAWVCLERYINWRNERGLDAFLESPAMLMRRGLSEFSCSGIPTNVSPELLLATSVDIGRHKVYPAEGVRWHQRRYYAPILLEHRPANRGCDLKQDCENPHLLRASVHGRWHPVYSSRYQDYQRLSEPERLAEATRLYDGPALRDRLIEEARCDLAACVTPPPDEPLVTQPGPAQSQVNGPDAGRDASPVGPAPSVFDRAREVQIDLSLDTQPEVPPHVLDFIRTQASFK